MLTKKQLEDAARCRKIYCEDCSFREIPHCGSCDFDLRRELIAQTALAYREMLERLEWAGLTNSNCYYCVICGRRKEKGHQPDCELAALLKESEAKEG
jgi:hypothetical protein